MKAHSGFFKIMYVHRFLFLSFILFLSILLLAGCSTFELSSSWRDREITVDGKSNDWLGALMYIEGENISLGLLNDENFLYICMIAESPLIRTQVMIQGFTLWFDPDGGEEKTFGIRFPVEMKWKQGQRSPMRIREGEQGQEKTKEAFTQSLTELEILGPGENEKKRLPVEEVKGIEVDLEASSGMLVYELKVPLNHSEEYPHAVGVEAGNWVGIGLETPKIDRKMMRERMGAGRPGGGGGRGGMGGMPGGRGMGGGRRPEMPDGLKIWAVVQLASKT